MVRLRDAGRFSNRFNFLREAIGASSVLARLRGRPRAEQARCHHLLVDALENRVLLSTLPAPVTTLDQNITATTGTNYSSPAVASDPNAPLDLIEVATSSAGAVQAAYSFDGGAQWISLANPANQYDPLTGDPFTNSSSPTISTDQSDNFYISYIEQSASGNSGEIVVQKFTFSPGGVPGEAGSGVAYRWQNANQIAYSPDIAVDNNQGSYSDTVSGGSITDNYAGNIYVTFASGGVAWVAASSDGGTDFSIPLEQSSGDDETGQQSVNAATPKIVVSQGNESGSVTGGDITTVWGDSSGDISAQSTTGVASGGEIFTGPGGSPAPIAPATSDGGSPAKTVTTVNTYTLAVDGSAFTDPNFTTLTDFAIELNITDPNMEQLSATLTAPESAGGATYTLFLNQDAGTTPPSEAAVVPAQGISGSGMDAIFDDQAPIAIDSGSAGNHVGLYRPEDPANAGVGESPFDATLRGLTPAQLEGNWTLKITAYDAFTTPPTQQLNGVGLYFVSGGSPSSYPVVIGAGEKDSATGSGFSAKPASDPDAGIGPGISLASDNTVGPYSQYSGRIYVAYTSTANNGDIVLSYSDDGGLDWSTPTTVNDDGGSNSQYSPAIAVDPTNGTLVLTWYDARDDASDTRVARYITTSIDGGNTFGGQTFLNESNTVYDAITGDAVNLGPIPDNISSGANGTIGFGDSQGLAVDGGHVYAVWSGNQNGGATGSTALDILTSTTTFADGPRVVASTQGTVSTANDIVNPAINNQPALQYIDITFDRPIVPDAGTSYDPGADAFYFDPAALTIYYRNDSTAGTAPPTAILPLSDILSIQPLDYTNQGDGDDGEVAAEPAATEFRITLSPQYAPGTYSYSINDIVESTSPLTYAISDGFVFNGISNFQAPYNISATASDIAAGEVGYDTNLPVPAVNSKTQASQIEIPASLPAADNGTIVDVNVTVDLDGAGDALSYLDLYLIAPDRDVIPLSLQRVGASETTSDVGTNSTIGGNGFISTVFDDQASTPVAFGNYQFSGTYKPDSPDPSDTLTNLEIYGSLAAENVTVPEGPGTVDFTDGGNQGLATFNGETLAAGGVWTLFIVSSQQNNGVNKVGVLRDWGLQFTTGTFGSYTSGNPMDQNADAITGQASMPVTPLAGSPLVFPGTIGDAYVTPNPTSNNAYTIGTAGNYYAAPYDSTTLPLIVPGPEVLTTRTYDASTDVTALTTGLTNGETDITLLDVNALTAPLAAGSILELVSGSSSQFFTLSAAASAGDTTLTVASFTANADYAAGSAVESNTAAVATNSTTPGTVTSTITVGGDSDVDISDLTVNLNLSAGAGDISGLVIQLIYTPAGGGDSIPITLVDQTAGGGTGFGATVGGEAVPTIFSDSATISIQLDDNELTLGGVIIPYSGFYQPATPLNVLNGQTLAGTYALVVSNYSTTGGNVATINSWSITASTSITAVDPNSGAGVYSVPIYFSEPMDPTTVENAGVTLVGPDGPLTGVAFTITPDPNYDPNYPDTENRQYLINFSTPLTLTGAYSLVLGDPSTGAVPATASTVGYGNTEVPLDSDGDDGLDILRSQAPSSSDDHELSVSATAPFPAISKYNGTDGIVSSTLQVGGAGGNTITDVTNAADPFTVTGDAQDFLISGLTVTVQLSYPRASELTLILVSPQGTAIQLFSNLSTTTGSFSSSNLTIFSDTASVSITGQSSFMGTFSPQEPLSLLDGQLASGTWTLLVKDNGANTGSLVGWSLKFTAYNPDTATSEPGDDATVGLNVFNMGATNPQSHETWNPVGGSSDSSTSASASASGPVTAIAVDPSDPTGNTVYVGAATGGVWKTTDFLTTDPDGPTYVPLTNFLGTDTSNIGSIAVLGSQTDPATGDTVPSQIFAGTGELYDVNAAGQASADNAPGAGILISLDGGQTWTVNTDNGAFDGLIANKVIVDPNLQANGEAIIYAAFTDPQYEAGTKATDDGGVYVSTNSGATWTSLKTGQATDIVFEQNSGVGAFQQGVSNPTHNLNDIVAAFQGVGIYFSPNRGSTWTLLSGVGDDALILNGTTPVTVFNSAGVTPGAGDGRIVLATPALTGNTVEDTLYQGWIYAAVVSAPSTTGGFAGTVIGLYMTKDNGSTWTKIDISANVAGGNTTGSDIGVSAGNYAIALSVDPTDPNVVYLASTSLNGAGAGMIRIDTTGISDAHSFYIGETDSTSGELRDQDENVADNLGATGTYSNPIDQPTINLIQNPSEPFVTNATLKVSDIFSFNNYGTGISVVPFTGASTEATFYHTIVTEVDPLTGEPRLILGTEQGVFTGVDNDGTFVAVNPDDQEPAGPTSSASLNQTPLGSRNGNLQIAEFYYGAVQPSQNAADTAGALFYGNAQGAGLTSSTSDVLSTGDTDWNAATVPSGGAGVATDPTGSGAVYDYANPLESGAGTNFFQVNGVGRTSGLITVNDLGADTTNDSEWPDLSATGNGSIGYNFAVNPLDGDQIVISSKNGDIYSTDNQGENWSLITSTGGLDLGSNALTLAYGAPTNQSANGNFIYAGTLAGHLYVTFTGGGEDAATWYPINIPKLPAGDYVEAIAPDPTPGSYDVYAVTQNGVYYLSNAYEFATGTKDPATGVVPSWVAITSNLPKLSGTPTTGANLLTTMTADWRYLTPVLYVGADSGVYRGIENTTTDTWTWTLFPNVATDSAPVDGGDLPDVEITDLDLATGNVNPTTGLPQTADGDPDALVASTFGRGAYAIRLAPIVASTTAAVPANSSTSDKVISAGTGSYITNDPTLTFSGSSERLISGYNQADISVYLLDVNGVALGTPEFLGGYNPADTSTNPADPNGQFNLANVANASGNFGITLTNALPSINGEYTIGIRATDNAGAQGSFSTVNIALEVTPPAITSLALTTASDTGTSDTDGITRIAAPTIVGQGAAGAAVTITLTNNTTNAVETYTGITADSNGQFTYTLPAQADGTYTLAASEVDIFGNSGPVFTAPNSLEIITSIATPTAPATASAAVTSDTQPVFTGTGDGSNIVGVTVTITPAGGSPVSYPATTDSSGNYTFTAPVLADGVYTVTAQQTDVAGNVSAVSPATTITIDTTAPVVFATPISASQFGNFNGEVATFTDANPTGGQAAATIDWGDGNPTSTGTIEEVDGVWEVIGTHVYSTPGTYYTTVTVTDAAGNTGTSSTPGTVTVGPPAITVQAESYYVKVGTEFNEAIAAFSSGVTSPPQDASDFDVTIDWGDGSAPSTSSDGLGDVNIVQQGMSTNFTIDASHTYSATTLHNYLVTITVTSNDGTATQGSTTSNLVVTPATQLVSVQAQPAFTGNEGATPAPTIVIADVASNGDLSAGDFANDFSTSDFSTPSINWGDGTPGNPDVTSGTIVPDGSGGFLIEGTHTYDDGDAAGTHYTITTTEKLDGATLTIPSDSAVITNVAPTIHSITGTNFALVNQPVTLSFNTTDPSTADTDHGFTYSINWGDGTVTSTPTHSYTTANTYTISVTAKDKDNGVSAAQTFSVDIAQLEAAGSNIAASEGSTTGNVVLATLVGASTAPNSTTFPVSVNWGDGTGADTNAIFVQSGNNYLIEDAHTYADGPHTYSITVSAQPVGDAATTVTDTANVSNVAPTLAFNGTPPAQALVGQTIDVPITATDPGTVDTATGFTYNVIWGDNGSTAQTIPAAPDNGTGYAPSHVYTAAGNYSLSMTATDKDAAISNTLNSTIQVAGLSASNISSAEGSPFSGTVATITNASSFSAGGFTASINWGDGTTTAGTITSNGDGTFSITGTHTYADGPAADSVVTTLTFGSASATATGTATVSDVAPTASLSGPSFAISGQSVTFTIGATDPGTVDTADGFNYLVNFGDGATQNILATPGNNSGQSVTHAYSAGGNYTVSVTATDKDGAASAAVSQSIAIAGVASASLADVNEGSTFSGTVASITNAGHYSASSFSATINWGDGSAATSGTISPDPNNAGDFLISGSHAFGDGPATDTVTVTVTSPSGTVTSTAALKVDNVAPTVSLSAATGGFTGQSLPLTISATDPSAADTAAGFTYQINWGDGATQTIGATANNGGGATPTHTYSALGNYTVTVTATDKDGGVSTAATHAIDIVAATQIQNFTGSANSISFTLPQTAAPITSLNSSDFTLVRDGSQTISLANAPVTFDASTGDVTINTSGLNLPAGDYQIYPLPGTQILPGSFSIGINESALLTKVVKLNPGKKVKAPTIKFPTLTLGGAAEAPVILALQNISTTQSLTLSQFAFLSSGPFSYAVENQPYGASSYTIGAGQTLYVRVYYTPTVAGSSSNKLKAQFNNGEALNYGAVVAKFTAKAINPKATSSITRKILKGDKSK